ncbi:MAG: hypothetical protein ACO1OB_19180 [Archangium sp.]
MSAPVITGAHCGKHPAVAAVEICTRCGTFLCGDCVEYVRDEKPACSDCAPLLRGVKASARAKLAPVSSMFGIAGLVTGFMIKGRPGLYFWAAASPLGLVGFALSVMELRLMRGSTVVQHGRRWARAGVVLGAIFLLGFVGILALFAAFMFATREQLR